MKSCIVKSGENYLDGLSSSPGWRGRFRVRGYCAKGTILIVTIWILLVLAGLVIVLGRSMRVEGVCSANTVASQQVSAIEQGAIQYVLAHLAGLDGRAPSEEDMPSRGVQIGEGAFWIIKPDYEDDTECLYGVVDEASRVNLNSATLDMLLKLPDMTNELAAGIVDWRDGDSEPTPQGAETEYYLLLANPYECKNSPLETVEELLLVNGASREILFGEDANRNGVLDENENDATENDPPDDRDGKLDRGIYDLVTVYSIEPNTTAAGSQRLDVNKASRQTLSKVLIKSVSQSRLPNILNLARSERPFQNVLDFYFRTGLTVEEFTGIIDEITTGGQKNLTGLINVNTACKEVLLTLPGLEESDVSALMGRQSSDGADLSNIAWVVEALPRKKAVGIGAHITGRSFQFSADIVSISGNGRAFRRCRIVIDARKNRPGVIYRQDLTHLGWALSPEIIGQLRTGTPMEQVIENFSKEVR